MQYEVRLVAKEFAQKREVNQEKKNVSTDGLDALLRILAIVAKGNHIIFHVEVATVFLARELEGFNIKITRHIIARFGRHA